MDAGLPTPPAGTHNGPCSSCEDASNMPLAGETGTCGSGLCRLVESLKAEIADRITREEATAGLEQVITQLRAQIARLHDQLNKRRPRHTTRVSISAVVSCALLTG